MRRAETTQDKAVRSPTELEPGQAKPSWVSSRAPSLANLEQIPETLRGGRTNPSSPEL